MGSGLRPTIKYAEGGAERQDSVTNGLRQIDCHLSNAVGRLENEKEAEHKEVHQVLQSQKEAFDARLTQELEQVTQSQTRIMSMCPECKRVSNRASEASFSESNLRMVRKRWRRDIKMQRHGNKQMTLHRGVSSAVQEKVEAQPRSARPPPWRDRLQRDIPRGWRRCNRGSESMLWLASSYWEHEATIQEGVKKCHLCLNNFTRLKRRTERVGQRDSASEFGLDFRYSERACLRFVKDTETKAHSEKFMNVNDVKR